MSPDHQLSERVYLALKGELLNGDIRELRLAIARLGSRYHTSATPVREALLRLVGEGVVDFNPSGGFSIPKLSEDQVRDLYDLNMRVMLAATTGAGRNDGQPSPTTRVPHSTSAVANLFLDIAEATQNQAMVSLVESLNDRMHLIRRTEKKEFPDVEREVQIMIRNFQLGERVKLRRSIIAYHHRRVRNCPRIWARLLSNAEARLS